MQSRASRARKRFVLSGGTLTVSNTIQVNGSFTVSGGTLHNATTLQSSDNQPIQINNGTFDGVTVNGDLDLSTVNGAHLQIMNGLVLNGTAFLGSQADTSRYGFISFIGTQSLTGNGIVSFGHYTCNALRVVSGATTLTIGPNILIHGHSGRIGDSTGCFGGAPNVGVINQGTIAADTSGGTIYLLGQSVTNLGSLQAATGTLIVTGLTGNIGAATVTGEGTLDLTGTYVNEQNRSVINSTLIFRGAWTNAASIALSNATFSTRGTWRNSGSINATNASVDLGGTFTVADLGTLNRNAGSIQLSGTLDNGGGVVALNAASGSWVINGGILRNAVLNESGGALLFINNGTFDGVTVNGDLDLSTVNGAHLQIMNGLVLNGTAFLGSQADTSRYGFISFIGTQSFTGNGIVSFGHYTCNALRVVSGATTLTIGPNILRSMDTADESVTARAALAAPLTSAWLTKAPLQLIPAVELFIFSVSPSPT
jgi:hypothetical protein